MERDQRATYYFLGIALRENVNQGIFDPLYVLCKANTTSKNRTGYRVAKLWDGTPSHSWAKVLVTEPYGHDDLLNFLSVYQTQDTFKGKHYFPSGYLCWYRCNKYGDPSGEVIVVRKVPYTYYINRFAEMKKFKHDGFNKRSTLLNLLTREPKEELYIDSGVKPHLYQMPGVDVKVKRRRRIKYGKSSPENTNRK